VSIFQKIRAETQAGFPPVFRDVRDLRQEMEWLEHQLDILNQKKAEKRKLWKIEKR
jgi:hypothetical protein